MHVEEGLVWLEANTHDVEWMMDSFSMNFIFTRNKEYSNLYFKVEGGKLVILQLYIDDLFITGEDDLIADTNKSLSTNLKIKKLGMMHYLLGIEVWFNKVRK